MKKWCLLLAVCICSLAAAFASNAANHEVETLADWDAAFLDTDDTVWIHVLNADLELDEYVRPVNENQTYYISGEAIPYLWVNGAGTIHVDTDISCKILDCALYTEGDVKIIVNGDITSNQDGIFSIENSSVEVNGDIITVRDAVYTTDTAAVTVNGEIRASSAAVIATGESAVKVNGNVLGGGIDTAMLEDSGEYGAYAALEVTEQAEVEVKGNVTGNDAEEPAENGELYFGNMNEAGGWSDGFHGACVYDKASLTIVGNVSGGDAYGTAACAGTGICAFDHSKVSVDGNVTGGSVTASKDVKEEAEEAGYAGDGIQMDAMANVTVTGNTVGGNSDGDHSMAGSGLYITLRSKTDYPKSRSGKAVVEGIAQGGTTSQFSGIDGDGVYFNVITSTNLFFAGSTENLIVPKVTVGSAKGGDAGNAVYTALIGNANNELIESVEYTMEQEAEFPYGIVISLVLMVSSVIPMIVITIVVLIVIRKKRPVQEM